MIKLFFVTPRGGNGKEAILYGRFYNHIVRLEDIEKILLHESLPEGYKLLYKDNLYQYIVQQGLYANFRKKIDGYRTDVENLEDLMNDIDNGNYQFGRKLFKDTYYDSYNLLQLDDLKKYVVLQGPYFRTLDTKTKAEMLIENGTYIIFTLEVYQTLLSLREGLENPDF